MLFKVHYSNAFTGVIGMSFTDSMLKTPSRRTFLRTAPIAAAAGLTLTDTALFASSSLTPEGQAAQPIKPEPLQSYTAQALQDAAHTLQTEDQPKTRKGEPKNGNKDLANSKKVPFTYLLVTEEKKTATEFEMHDGRDHIISIIDGSTVYVVGGTPVAPRSHGEGEWLVHVSEGARTITMNKGDILVLPRGTPHKRITEDSVVLTQLSPMEVLKD
jgi:mannose-6-phosphate isomerase-like protein (cupin superfamily)